MPQVHIFYISCFLEHEQLWSIVIFSLIEMPYLIIIIIIIKEIITMIIIIMIIVVFMIIILIIIKTIINCDYNNNDNFNQVKSFMIMFIRIIEC